MEGSTPSSSTSKGEKVPRNTKKDTDNQKDCRCLSVAIRMTDAERC